MNFNKKKVKINSKMKGNKNDNYTRKQKKHGGKTLGKTLLSSPRFTNAYKKTQEKASTISKGFSKTASNILDKTTKIIDTTSNRLNTASKTLNNTKAKVSSLSGKAEGITDKIKSMTESVSDILPTIPSNAPVSTPGNSKNDNSNTFTLIDDITNLKNLFSSLFGIITDNDILNEKLKELKNEKLKDKNSIQPSLSSSSSSSLVSSNNTSLVKKYSDNIDDLLSFLDGSAIASLKLAYLNLQKGYIVSLFQSIQPLINLIQTTYSKIKNTLGSISSIVDNVKETTDRVKNVGEIWNYLQLLLGIFFGNILNILFTCFSQATEKINIQKIIDIITTIKEEEMEYFMKAFDSMNKNIKDKTGDVSKGLKLFQTMVLLLYLIHRTIVEGNKDLDKAIVNIEPLFKKLLKIAENVDEHVVAPVSSVIENIQKNKKELKENLDSIQKLQNFSKKGKEKGKEERKEERKE